MKAFSSLKLKVDKHEVSISVLMSSDDKKARYVLYHSMSCISLARKKKNESVSFSLHCFFILHNDILHNVP